MVNFWQRIEALSVAKKNSNQQAEINPTPPPTAFLETTIDDFFGQFRMAFNNLSKSLKKSLPSSRVEPQLIQSKEAPATKSLMTLLRF